MASTPGTSGCPHGSTACGGDGRCFRAEPAWAVLQACPKQTGSAQDRSARASSFPPRRLSALKPKLQLSLGSGPMGLRGAEVRQPRTMWFPHSSTSATQQHSPVSRKRVSTSLAASRKNARCSELENETYCTVSCVPRSLSKTAPLRKNCGTAPRRASLCRKVRSIRVTTKFPIFRLQCS